MKKIITLLAATSIVAGAHADTVIDDFTSAVNGGIPFVMTDNSNAYQHNDGSVGNANPYFQDHMIGGANYSGNGDNKFKIFENGNGYLTARGFDTASGQLDLSYANDGFAPADLTGVSAINLDVTKNTGGVSIAWGFYSNGFSNESSSVVNLAAGTTGNVSLNFSSLVGDSLVANNVQSFFIEAQLNSSCSTFQLHNVEASTQAVPEPCTMLTLGVGAVGLLRRKRK